MIKRALGCICTTCVLNKQKRIKDHRKRKAEQIRAARAKRKAKKLGSLSGHNGEVSQLSNP